MLAAKSNVSFKIFVVDNFQDAAGRGFMADKNIVKFGLLLHVFKS
jgi:hypothetical protein